MGLIPASLATLVGAFPVIVSLSSLMPTQCLRRREGTAGGNSLSLRTFIGKSSLDYISRRGMAGSNILYLCRCCWIKALWKCLIWNFTTLIWAYWSWKWIQDCPVLQSNHEPVVPAEGRTTWWTPHLGLHAGACAGQEEVLEGLGAGAGTCHTPVAMGCQRLRACAIQQLYKCSLVFM